MNYLNRIGKKITDNHRKEISLSGVRSRLGIKPIIPAMRGWQLVTLERLFKNFYNESLNRSIYSIEEVKNRISFLVEQTIRITGLKDFGKYMSELLTIDAFFLNEDRHTHNIAVLQDDEGKYHYCPIFDNGAGLLSDTTMDYPMNVEIEKLMKNVTAKTFSRDFDEQLDCVEKLYGQHIKFHFNDRDLMEIMEKEEYYPQDVKERVANIIMEQKRKYRYLFS